MRLSRYCVLESWSTELIALQSLVFVHGLTGGQLSTWTARSASDPWLQTILPSHVPRARILAFGYDAFVTSLTSIVSTNRVENHAKNLLSTLANYRDDDDTVSLYLDFWGGFNRL